MRPTPFTHPSREVRELLQREAELQRENDLLWDYFRLSVNFFAAAELHDLKAAKVAHESLQELAAKLLAMEDDE